MVPQGRQRQSWYHKVVKDRTLMRTSRMFFNAQSAMALVSARTSRISLMVSVDTKHHVYLL